jgi:cardiolipin synthase
MATHPVHTTGQFAEHSLIALTHAGREILAKRCIIPLHGAPLPLDDDRPTLDESELERVLHRLSRSHLSPARVEMDIDGEEALRRLEGLIDSANESIDVLMYLWDSDALGWGIAQRLAARARVLPSDGCCAAVRVLIDGGGNLIHGEPSCTTGKEANEVLGWLAGQPNVEVLRTRNPLARFDHRKLVIVDGRIAWTGGRNFTLPSFFEYHDASIVVQGPLVAELAESFAESWGRSGGKPRCVHSRAGGTPEPITAWARLVGTGQKRRDFARVLYKAVDHSCHHIYLENPYFTDNLLWCKLAHARRRGADVRVVYAANSQSKLIDKAMRVTANRFLKIGVRVYCHPGTTHAKAAAVDSRWAYIGTGNFDNLSLRRNNEVGLSIGAGPMIDEIERRLFLNDFRPEWEVTEPFPVHFSDYLCEALASIVL